MFHKLNPDQAAVFTLAYRLERECSEREPHLWSFKLEEVGIFLAKSWASGYDRFEVIRGLSNDGIESPILAARNERLTSLDIDGIGGLGIGLPSPPFT